MEIKTLIILIVLVGLGTGGVLVYKYLLVEKEPIDKGIPYLLYMPSDKGPIDRVNQNIPSHLLYQSKSEEIPEQHLLVWNEKLNTDLIFWQDSESYCRSSNEKAQKIEYFYRNPGSNVEGGWRYRYALICGDNYWIIDGADWFGVKIYGLFEKTAPFKEEKEATEGQLGEQIEEQAVLPKEEEKPAPIPVQITFLENLAADPSWSPDGSKIVFLGLEKDHIKGGLYMINSDGTGLTSIGPWERDHLFNPSWSPVGNKVIAYGERENSGLFLVDLDEDWAQKVQLTVQKVEHASWRPDGNKIAYNVYNEDKSFSSIWTMNADGSGKTQLTTDEDDFCTGPSFSYDGLKIVYLKGFTTTMPGPKPEEAINEIWVMNNDGSNEHMIYAPGDGMQLIRERAWNKNNKIIFAKHQYQRAPQIWVISSDGTNPQCILDPEEGGIPTAIYDDAVWDNSGTKVAVTKVILTAAGEPWQVATFSWEE